MINRLGLAFWLLFSGGAMAVEFESMDIDQYYQTINKAHKAYRSGRLEAARALYNLTARWGEKDCQRLLGVMLVSGQGGEVDMVEGFLWLLLAAESKRREDLKTLKEAQDEIPKAAQSAAGELFDEYLQSYGKGATGIRCKRKRQGNSARKTMVCERRRGTIQDSSFDVPVVDSQYFWAIQD